MQKKYISLKEKLWKHFQSLWVNLGCFPVAKLQSARIHHHANSRIMAHINRSCIFSLCFILFYFFNLESWKIWFFESSFCLGVWVKDVEAVGNPKEVAAFPHKSINSPFLSHTLISFTASVSHSDSTKHHLQWFQIIWAVLWFGSQARSVNLLTNTFTNSVINTNNELTWTYHSGWFTVDAFTLLYLNKNK